MSTVLGCHQVNSGENVSGSQTTKEMDKGCCCCYVGKYHGMNIFLQLHKTSE